MLQRILKLMASGEAMTQRDLAKELDVPEPLVSQMVDQLVRRGYLREGNECAVGCDGCRLQAACGTLESLHLWTLTDKGRRAVQS